MGKVWEIYTHTFPMVWVLFPYPIPILWYTSAYGKCMGFPKNSPQNGKCNKTHGMGKVWEINNHTFLIVWVFFSHPIPILWYTSAYGKCMGFPINFPQYGKMQQNPQYGESLGNLYSYFSHGMGAFFPSDSHPMVYFSTWEMHGFPHKFPIVRENATKLTVWGKSGKSVTLFWPFWF